MEQMLNNDGWLNLNPTSIKFFASDNQATQSGLQSILIQRTNPLFNSHLLLPELKTPVGSKSHNAKRKYA